MDPFNVRHLQGSYAEGLARLEERFHPNMEEWKKALQKVVELAGHHFKDGFIKLKQVDRKPEAASSAIATQPKRRVQKEEKPKRKTSKPSYLNHYV
ncbi:hypothetical protein JHK87_016548 [Glycine soja]|nr:hypothetical protein JHK87_016548 [Glycine soja]